MKIVKTIEINRPSADVWQLVAEQFDQAHKWMGFVENSYAVEGSSTLDGAPMAGRVCEFTPDPNGLKAKEKILNFSKQKMQFEFDVVPLNTPRFFPVKKNVVTMSVKKISDTRSEVTWVSKLELSAIGYVIHPLLKRGLSKNFANVLRDLREYMQTNSSPLTVA